MRGLKTAITISLFPVMFFGFSSAVPAEESQPIEEKDVPAAVIDSFKAAYPDLAANEIERGEIDGKVYYEFDCLRDEMDFDVVYLADGSLYSIKEEIEIDALPEEVMEALSIAYPDGEIDEAEQVTRGSATEFEIAVMIYEADEVLEFEVQVDPEGNIISSQPVAGDDDDEGDENFDEEDDEEE
jgi:hypothetical protein